MPPKKQIDYTLYLVTGRELLPPGREYFEHLEEVKLALGSSYDKRLNIRPGSARRRHPRSDPREEH